MNPNDSSPRRRLFVAILVLGASLWWHWDAEFIDAPANARLLQNVLTLGPGK